MRGAGEAVEDTDLRMRAINPPQGFWESEDPGEVIHNNVRALLQKLGIRVYVFRDRIEIRGLIPVQVLSASGADRVKGEPIIFSARRGGYRG